ncbi:MAG TPA: gas vesicle protein GvpG [Solirubrobacteraceae bacterium]|nr:gas vesicle protein GvpG [Solirubrobacteraceae bacterium]
MGLFTSLITLPLAPVRGVAWVVEQVADEADRQLYDPARLRGELLRLELDHDTGLVGDQEYEQRSDELLERIAAASRARAAGEVLEPDGELVEPEVSDG